MPTHLFAIIALFVVASGPVYAQQRAPAAAPPVRGAIPSADAPGARDAAALPRYAGAILLENRTGAFDEIALPNARLERAPGRRDGRNNALNLPPAPLRAEGRLTRLSYLMPEGRSPLEVVRGYQQVVREAGGQVLYECSGAECGGTQTGAATIGGNETGLIHMLYPFDMVAGNATQCVLGERLAQQRFTLLDLPNAAGKVALLTWNVGEVVTGSDCRAWVGRTVALVVLVEAAAREQRMETVQAAALGQGLAREGRVALYAILFDTGRAELKPESQPQLAELVLYLRSVPAVRALVVGHTDNQGALDFNLDLSRRRAQAVVAALTAQGIPPARLVAQGVGMAAPLASNEAEEGRARNRRVELVRQ